MSRDTRYTLYSFLWLSTVDCTNTMPQCKSEQIQHPIIRKCIFKCQLLPKHVNIGGSYTLYFMIKHSDP